MAADHPDKGSDSVEYRTLHSLHHELAQVMKSSVHSLASKLWSKSLISESTMEEMQRDISNAEKANKLLSDALAAVIINHNRFKDFIAVLDEPYFDDVRKKLESECANGRNPHPIDSRSSTPERDSINISKTLPTAMRGDSSSKEMSESISMSTLAGRSALPECTRHNASRAIKEVSFENLPHFQVQLISTTQMSEVNRFCRDGDEMKNRTIDVWFQNEMKQGQTPSWEKLIEALENSSENVIAKSIKDGIIFTELSHDMPPLQLIKADSQDSGSLSPLSPAPPPDNLPPDDLPRARTKSKIGKQISRRTEVHIQAKYISLENDMITLLEERNIEFNKFRYFGNMFFPPELVEGASNARNYLEKARISKMLNPWNYFPLKDIMLLVLKGEDHQRVEAAFDDYHDHLNNYLSVTSILNFLHDKRIEELLVYPTGCKRRFHGNVHDLDHLSFKLRNVTITEKSLKYIQDLWKSLSGYLRLNQSTVLLQSIRERCIEINWLVSSEVSVKMCEIGPLSKEFFTQHHITWVLINEECIYDEEIHAKLNMSKARHSLSDACKNGKKMEIESLLKVPGIDIKEMQSSALLMTAGHGHLNIIEFLINSGAKVNAQDETGSTALISASAANHIKTVKYLLDKGANSAIQENEKGYTALHAAAENGNLEIVRCLIELSSLERDIDIKDKEGNKPVDIAMKNVHQRIVEELLGVKDESATCVEDESATCDDEDADKMSTYTEEEKAPVQKSKGLGRLLSAIRKTITPFSKEAKLMQAARVGNHEEVERLLKMGAKPNHREADSLRWTPLMWASQEGHTETVKCLLKNGADPNEAALNGFTPLILASRTGQCEVVEALLDPNNPIKTDVNMRNKTRGWSALMWAAQSRGKGFKSPEAEANRRKVAEYLLDAGADVNLPADNGWTPLMQASQDGCTELVKILCKTAAIDHQSKGTWTALTTACKKGNTDVIKVLVEAGADVNKKKKGGVTSMHIASYKNLVNAMESIVSANADINIKDDWGMTPLILAVKQQNKEMIRYLIKEVKVNVNIVAEKYFQWSPLFFATENKDKDTVDLLLENKADVTVMDEYKHTILSYSKGLFTRKMMHKYLLKKLEHSLPPEEEETQAKSSHSQLQKIESSHSVTPLDQALYAGRDFLWRTTQRIHITVNTAF